MHPATPTPPSEPYTLYIPNAGHDDGSAPTESPLPTPSPAGPTPLPPPVFKPGTGVQIHLFAGDDTQTLLWAQGLGVEWVKQQIDWNIIEHGPNDLEWDQLDRVVEMCEAFGFKLLIGVVNAPSYLRPDPTWFGPPTDYAEFGRFMEQLATRYRGRVAAYELWNEPNLAREWTGDALDPVRFTALVVEGAHGVHAGDPDALSISGAPAVTGINDGIGAIDDRVFLRGILAAGIAQHVDGIGAHPYGFGNPPQASYRDAEQSSPSHNNHPSFFFRDTLEDYRALLIEFEVADIPIWVTEFGWPSVEGMGSMDTQGWEYGLHITERIQAVYTVQSFQTGMETDWIGPMFLWNLNLSTIWGSDRPESAYSVLHADGSYRPVYIDVRLAGPP
jgi:hypothetical protein